MNKLKKFYTKRKLARIDQTDKLNHMNERSKAFNEICIAKFATHIDYDLLPPEVIKRVKDIFRDTIGVMIRATSAPSLFNLRKMLIDGNSGVCTVFGSNFKANPYVAAFLNASLPTVTQYDEGHRFAAHPGIHIIPAAFAMGEYKRIAGKDLIVAILLGYEVSVRIGLAILPMHPDIHPHGNWSIIGAAVSAGKILSFSEEQFVDLINSISTLTLSTWRKATTSGATIHHLTPGLGTSHAIAAALAIQAGMTGPSSCLKDFFLPLHSAHSKPEINTANLGETYEVMNNYFKAYPSCAHIHSSIEALKTILSVHTISVGDVDRVEVRIYPAAGHLREQNPPNMLAGIFSIPYCLAMWLVKGELNLESIATEAPVDSQVLKIASLIRVVIDEELKPPFPQGRPALVKIRLKNGREYKNFVALPQEKFTENELGEKFLDLVEPLLGENRAKDLKGKIDKLEILSDVGQLFG